MVKIDIEEGELKALDVILDSEQKIKPVVGYLLTKLRFKIQQALNIEKEKALKEKYAEKKVKP